MIHGSYNSTGTESTRLSANNPNMQQLSSKVGDPRRFDYKYPIKRLFRTRFEGGGMLQLDYSALEMRILGLIAKDKAMTQAFINGEDMHEATASLVWKLPKDNVPKDMRQRAKSVNFGIAYGKHNCRLVA
ncbi:putative DNA polymerase [Enterococcus phage ECP3]|nr:DNA polymerase [Enterococcus phage ECP3]AII28407.1 putative DNA polymerase [Enterococcus phage ECP3]